MIILYLNQNQIKILFFKKSVFSHYEVNYFEKNHQTLLINGQKPEIDFLASAIKEGLDKVNKNQLDKEVYLILPQNFFIFLRTEVPLDIAPSAIYSFVWEKVKKQHQIESNQLISELFITENQQKKTVNFYGINLKNLENFQQIFNLLNLKLINIIPETLTYFKLFEKTLRSEKKENIFFVHYHQKEIFGYLFDNFGLIGDEKWFRQIDERDSIEKLIKEKKEFLEKNHQLKINRLILSGPASENIRQDTFTKNVGIWTNPLKKIIINFYQDYLKFLMVENKEALPILSLDACFGAFVFLKENPNFSFLRKRNFYGTKTPAIKKTFNIKKEWLIFFVSFILSFLFFIFISNIKIKTKLPSLFTKSILPAPTTTPLPSFTPTPTTAINKEKIRIKILNGSGIPGKASSVKDILKEKGYQEILTGNADSFEYEQTEISVKKEKTNLLAIIKEDLKKYVSSFKVTALSEEDPSDIIVIIGKDFK